MRVHFELKYGADTVEQARSTAYEEVSKFMGVDLAAVPNLVDVELKVAIPDQEKDAGLTQHFVVTAFGNVKLNVANLSK